MKGSAARPQVSQKGFGMEGEELITIMMGKRSIGHGRGTQVFHLQLPSVGKSEMHSAPVNLDLTSGKRIPILFGVFAKTWKNESASSVKTQLQNC